MDQEKTINNNDVAWAAGLFSGLGTFYYHMNTPALILTTIDAELAERFRSIVEVGKIQSFPRNDYALYHWITLDLTEHMYVIELFDDYLTSTLRRKATGIYTAQVSGGFKVVCKRGHIRLPVNLTKNNQCKPCIAFRRISNFYLDKNMQESATMVE